MNDERINELLDIPGVVLGSELANLDTLHDIECGTDDEPKPSDVDTVARWQGL
jgi:hypothetical protein